MDEMTFPGTYSELEAVRRGLSSSSLLSTIHSAAPNILGAADRNFQK